MSISHDPGSGTKLKRVLCVDDDADICFLTQFVLSEVGGLDVEIARTGREAIEKVESFRPDMILLDVMMPGMDGFSTLAAIRKMPVGSSVPVVFVTASAELAERRVDNGAIGVIAKPFDMARLPRQLDDLWRDRII